MYFFDVSNQNKRKDKQERWKYILPLIVYLCKGVPLILTIKYVEDVIACKLRQV